MEYPGQPNVEWVGDNNAKSMDHWNDDKAESVPVPYDSEMEDTIYQWEREQKDRKAQRIWALKEYMKMINAYNAAKGSQPYFPKFSDIKQGVDEFCKIIEESEEIPNE